MHCAQFKQSPVCPAPISVPASDTRGGHASKPARFSVVRAVRSSFGRACIYRTLLCPVLFTYVQATHLLRGRCEAPLWNKTCKITASMKRREEASVVCPKTNTRARPIDNTQLGDWWMASSAPTWALRQRNGRSRSHLSQRAFVEWNAFGEPMPPNSV